MSLRSLGRPAYSGLCPRSTTSASKRSHNKDVEHVPPYKPRTSERYPAPVSSGLYMRPHIQMGRCYYCKWRSLGEIFLFFKDDLFFTLFRAPMMYGHPACDGPFPSSSQNRAGPTASVPNRSYNLDPEHVPQHGSERRPTTWVWNTSDRMSPCNVPHHGPRHALQHKS